MGSEGGAGTRIFTPGFGVVYVVGNPEQNGTSMTNTSNTNHSQDNDQQDKPGQGGNHPFKATVRTLAGQSRKDTVKPSDTVAELTDDAVKHFVAKGELTDGAYALTLPRTGGDAELDPTATLHDAGVVEDDVLVLVSRKPQVDG